jgi:hypothetical protein
MNTPRFLTLEKRQAAVAIEHSAFALLRRDKPRKTVVPLAIGLSWEHDGAIYQEKIDGVFTGREFGGGPMMAGGALLAGDTLPGGRFVAWDCLAFDGQDLRSIPAWERLNVLIAVCRRFEVRRAQESMNGGALLQDVLARGGEGVVRKLAAASYFDPMEAAKRVQTWRCVVMALDYSAGGAAIAERMEDGRLEDRGTVPLRNRAMACRVGSLVKVEGMELTAAGKIREPRPCKDTETSWLIQF